MNYKFLFAPLVCLFLASTTYAQIFPSILEQEWSLTNNTTEDHNALNAYNEYLFIEKINNSRKLNSSLEKRSNFKFKLDSVYAFQNKAEPQGSDIKSSGVWRYNEDQNKEILFPRSCDGTNCDMIGRASTLREYGENEKLLFLKFGTWSDGEYSYNCDVPIRWELKYNDKGLLKVFYVYNPDARVEYAYDDNDLLVNESGYGTWTGSDTISHLSEKYYFHNSLNNGSVKN